MHTAVKNAIDFEVPLSKSHLFDAQMTVKAQKLCERFPGLHYSVDQDSINIFGNLDEQKTAEFNKAVFSLGMLPQA